MHRLDAQMGAKNPILKRLQFDSQRVAGIHQCGQSSATVPMAEVSPVTESILR